MRADQATHESEMLVLERVYHVTHSCFGTFIGRVVEPAPGWCGFVILESNEKLSNLGYLVGHYIELTADFYKARAL